MSARVKAYQDHEYIIKMCKEHFEECPNPKHWLLESLQSVIEKVNYQIQIQRSKLRESSSKRRYPTRKKRQFYYKQLADVVESVTGAVTLVCGVNFTQDYLRKIGVLKHDQKHLMTEMRKLIEAQEEKSGELEKEFFDKFDMKQVEKIIGYEFKCKAWLIEALTHKSYQREMEKFNTKLDDYERLEFLGDAVLGCLMARHFFRSTQNDDKRKMPKELHKMKTSVMKIPYF